MNRFFPRRRAVRPAAVLLAAFLFLGGCAGDPLSSDTLPGDTASGGGKTGPPERGMNKTGGFEAVSVDREDVREVFAWLIDTIEEEPGLEAAALERASLQVVAGIKYRLACAYSRDGARRLLEATVWERPDGSRVLLEIDYGGP